MFDKFIPTENLGKYSAADLVEKEKSIINELIEKSEISNKLKSAGLGYAILFSYNCSSIFGLIGKRKDQPGGFLNNMARIPKDYVSSIDIFITKNNRIVTVDDSAGGLISMNIGIFTSQPILNIFSKQRKIRINKNFFENSIKLVDDICNKFCDPNAKIINADEEFRELLDKCYLKS